jgi:nanoRNase/pAp phosphatase (c-di-AMP/oligoRNAs hydrolase)
MIREENLQLKQAKIEKNISRIKKSEEIIQRLTQEYQYQLKVSLDNSNTREKALNLLVNASGGRVIYIDHIEKIGD